MKKVQENILFLNWTLPSISFFFLVISGLFSASYHSELLLKIFMLCLGFSAIVSFVYRRSFVIGEAIFLGIFSIICVGVLPFLIQSILGLMVISLLFFEIKYLFQIMNRGKLLALFFSFAARQNRRP